jgi:hypothetical protein
MFFGINLVAGWRAAAGAMLTQFLFRAAIAGFFGSVIQAYGMAQPAWTATLLTAVMLPALTHLLEFLVHWQAGTSRLNISIVFSITYSVISALFNAFIVRRGVLIVGGEQQRSFGSDLRRLPRLMLDFVLYAPRALLIWPPGHC